jgi:hypothetical protein
MRKKRLFAFSLIIALSASFISLQIAPTRIASAQDVKVKQDGFITGCSETVIDTLDECVQERFGKFDTRFGITRMRPLTLHVNYFLPETQAERDAVSELEKGGWQVAFYLAGRRILGPKPDMTKFTPYLLSDAHPIINGPIAISGPKDFNKNKMIEQFDLPEPQKLWDDAQKAMSEFEKRDQYDFTVNRWNVAARPIRAGESCLQCHNNKPIARNADGATVIKVRGDLDLYAFDARSETPIKVGDALGVAMYAYTRKQKGASSLIR